MYTIVFLFSRFLNTRCVRYGHRAGKFQNAEWALRLFLRRAEGVECLEDLQVVWYTFAHVTGFAYHNMYVDCLRECERKFLLNFFLRKTNLQYSLVF